VRKTGDFLECNRNKSCWYCRNSGGRNIWNTKKEKQNFSSEY